MGGTVGGNVNYKAGKWNSFLSLEHLKRAYNLDGTFTRVFYDGQQTSYYDQKAYGKSKKLGPPNLRLGTDFTLNGRHSIGDMVYFNQNKRWEDFNIATLIGNQPQHPQQFITAHNYLVTPPKRRNNSLDELNRT